jgi:hypothetical protein
MVRNSASSLAHKGSAATRVAICVSIQREDDAALIAADLLARRPVSFADITPWDRFAMAERVSTAGA